MEKIGEGGEAEVFALDAHRVLRRFRRAHPSIARRVSFTAEVAAGAADLNFAVPEILDHFVDEDGRPCFVERRLPGRSMAEALGEVGDTRRSSLLASYLETAVRLRDIRFQPSTFGEIIAEDPLRTPTWHGYLLAALERQVAATDPGSCPELADLGATLDRIRTEVAGIPEPTPSLLHFDYFPGNVMCDDRRITAVIDWSSLSIVGDGDLDVALAVGYFGVTPTIVADDITFARRWLAERGLAERAAVYERWGAAWWLPQWSDPRIRAWGARVLAPVEPGAVP